MRYIFCLALLAFSIPAAAQPPVPVSLEYYQQRVAQTDAIAAQFMYERDQLRQRVEKLTADLKAVQDELAKLKAAPLRGENDGCPKGQHLEATGCKDGPGWAPLKKPEGATP